MQTAPVGSLRRHALRFAVALAVAPAAIAAAQDASATPNPIAPNVLHTFDGATLEFLGSGVDGAGDVNGDGFDDVVVGSPGFSLPLLNAGKAEIRSGQDGSLLRSIPGDTDGDLFGSAVAGAGDVNNDGVPDVIIGAPNGGPLIAPPGYARAYSGATGLPIHTFVGMGSIEAFGSSVAAAGDVNNDGFADLIVGAPGNDIVATNAGRAMIYSGATGLPIFGKFGDGFLDNLGACVAGAGDMNLDGFDDIIAGAPLDDDNGSDCGMARAYSGKTGMILHTWYGDTAGDNLGTAVAGVGDVNQDGFADVAIGAPLGDNAGSETGYARVQSGLTGGTIHSFDGNINAHLGAAIAGTGDVDQDGFPDLIVGSPDDKGLGAATLFSGLNGHLLRRFEGTTFGSEFGGAVGGAGDVNDDGVRDVIVGAWLDTSGGITAGRAKVFSGGCGPISTYGSGCPGTGGIVPLLVVSGCAAPGGTLHVSLSDALGGAPVMFFAGTAPAAIPIGGGCQFLIMPPFGSIGPIPLGGMGAGGGSIAFDVLISPSQPAAIGHLQAFVIDPASAIGGAGSNGVAFTIP